MNTTCRRAIAALTVLLIMATAVMPAAAGCGEEEATDTGTATSTKKPAGTPDSTSAALSDHAVTISEFICPYTQEDQVLTPGMITAFLLVEIENTSDAALTVSPGDFTLEGEEGESYDAVTSYHAANAIEEGMEIAPGETASGVLFFDIPDDVRVVYLVDDSAAETLKVELPRPTEQ